MNPDNIELIVQDELAFDNDNEKDNYKDNDKYKYYKDNSNIYDDEKVYPPSLKGSFLVLVYVCAL